MQTGSKSGNSKGSFTSPGLTVFKNNRDGFTSVSVALALMLSLTLLYSAVSAVWISSASSEVQQVADAGALAGENVVAAFSTITQVLDACVLSLGLTGVVVFGAGLVVSCVPGLTTLGASICQTGSKLLQTRQNFARSAAQGLETLEKALPLLIVANSASCVTANSKGSRTYTGCAIPYPLSSESDYSAFDSELAQTELEKNADELNEATQEVEAAQKEAEEALKAGWLADCGEYPSYCLYQRSSTLAGLSGSSNPYYANYDNWNFGVALSRARAYYRARLSSEAPYGSGDEQLTDSQCRKVFYQYAVKLFNAASYIENSDGTVGIDFPLLPKNTSQMRMTELYTNAVWPCTYSEGIRTIHSSFSCSAAQTETASGYASLSQLDAGSVSYCNSCKLSSSALGKVAQASSNIENGFEYWWIKIVEAAQQYQAAIQRKVEAENKAKQLAKSAKSLFSEALETISVARPSICPAGAWGCVAVVARGSVSIPSQLTAAFISSGSSDTGIAVSAAVLVSDDSESQTDVLSAFFDSLSLGDSLFGSAVDGVCELWGTMLNAYGSAYGSVSSVGSDFLDGFDSLLGTTLGSWLKSALKSVMANLGFEPADMRLRKPVITNTQNVLEKSGNNQASTIRSFVNALPEASSAKSFAASVGVMLLNSLGSGSVTLAEISIPGTDISIPLSIDATTLGSFL